jgi:hypothetical protein
MDRRTFLAGTGSVLLAPPLAAETHQAAKVYKIGVLSAVAAVAAAPRAVRVRVWQITSWGRGLRGGQPLPEGPSVDYPPSAPSLPFPAPPFPGHHAPPPHAVEPQAQLMARMARRLCSTRRAM